MREDLQISGPTSSGVALYPPGATFGPRVMREYEFVWMIEGHGTYLVDQKVIDAPEGSIVLCRPGTTDEFRWDPKRRTRHGFYHFQIRRVPSGWPHPGDWQTVRTSAAGSDLLVPLFKHLLTWTPRGDSALIANNIRLMLHAFVFGCSSLNDPPTEVLPEAVQLALNFMHDRLDRDPASTIRLDDLADVSLVTPAHLCRLFLASTGHRPVETVQLARLDRAAVLVCRSNFTLKQIAESCGFSSAFHLSRRFSEAFRCSPREMRKRIASGNTPPLPLLIRHPGRTMDAEIISVP